jgi:hypothetical protein
VDVNFSMVSYNPIRQNPSVMAETLLKLYPVFAQSENINKRLLDEELVNGAGLPAKLVIPQEEIDAQKQAMMEQQMAAAQGAAPAAPGGLPPELAALVQGGVAGTETTTAATQQPAAASLAAGGPSPVRV